MNFLIMGPPGAGKGTQAMLLSQKLGIIHISSGDLFRAAVKNGTALGKLAQSYMVRGEYVPDDVTTGLVLEKLFSPECAGGFLLDGFPRTLAQAIALDAALQEAGKQLDAVIYVAVGDAVLVERLSSRWVCPECQSVYNRAGGQGSAVCEKCGKPLVQREDDKPETVRRRIEVYNTATAPLIEYYRERGLLVQVNGEGQVDAVNQAIMAALRS